MNEKRLAGATGLTPSQLVVLQELARCGESTAGAISNTLHFSHAAVTNMVDRLEERAFVARERRDHDRRQVWVKLTPTGKEALSSAPDVMQDTFREQFEKLADWEQAMIVAMLERLTSLLNADTIDAAPVIDAGVLDRAGPAA
ncbi:MAG: MarR family transcriptional regulator [Rhodospirillaceae bacterium]|nr:MarR family transcriptional regulator [Rhodospirillaceae bacterium]